MIEDFWNELSEGEIHARDKLQFELKSEFFIHPHLKRNVYKQEVYLFIPSALQIHAHTYSKGKFYVDQTNLIRYKTPHMLLADLSNPHYSPSPLNRIRHYLLQPDLNLILEAICDEVKLFAVIFRVAVRDKVYTIIQSLQDTDPQKLDGVWQTMMHACAEISEVCSQYRTLQEKANLHSATFPQLTQQMKEVDEFISIALDELLTLLLKHIRSSEKCPPSIDQQICQFILKESWHRKKKNMDAQTPQEPFFASEAILHRQGLLNRFVMEALMLKCYRFSLEEKHGNILGAITAGIAMFVYMGLLVWKSSSFVINSFPFVVLAVMLYILKDRIKEGLKKFYYRQAFRWFPDYSTEIRSPRGIKIGVLKENFVFIEPQQLPSGFLKIRNQNFHEDLQALPRHETIIQYKREVLLHSPLFEARRREITIIFRLNIHRFLQKASNAFQPYLTLDRDTLEITEKLLPKVYHLNIIIRNTYFEEAVTSKVEIKTFRVIVDKEGIKRVEHLPTA